MGVGGSSQNRSKAFFGGSRWRKGRLRQAEFLGSVEGGPAL